MQLDESAILWPRGEPAPGRPLLILLHGITGHERDLLPMVALIPEEFAVASLRAPLPAAPGWAWLQVEPPLERIAAQADAAVDALVAWRERLHGVPFAGVMGFSQGGAIAVHAIRRAPHAFAFGVSMAGFVVGAAPPAEDEDREPLPLFVGYGMADQVIPFSWHLSLVAWAAQRTRLEEHTYPGLGHTVSEDELADVVAFLRARLRDEARAEPPIPLGP